MSSRRWIWVLLTACSVASAVRAQPPTAEVRHSSSVLSVAISPDGKTFASGTATGTIVLSDLMSGSELRRIETESAVVGLAFSPNGRLLGVKTDSGPYSTHSVTDGSRTNRLAGMTGYNASLLAFTADGNSLVGAGVGEQLTWHHSRGGASASRTANRPAGAYAAIAADGSATGWGQASGWLQIQVGGMLPGSPRQYHRLQVGPAQCMAFSPDVNIVTGNNDKLIRLWSLNGQELRKFEGLSEPAAHLAVSGNGKILVAAGATDPVLRVWDVSSGRLRRQVVTNLVNIKMMALTPDGRSLVTAAGDKAQVWNVGKRDLGELGPPVVLSKTQLVELWTELGSSDFVRADNAFKKLANGGADAIIFVEKQILRVAVPAINWKHVDKWIDDLDAEAYPVRQKAMAELAKLGELAEVPLRKVIDAHPSLEAANRATKLLARLKEPELSPDRLRALQAIDLLETLATEESRTALDHVRREALIARIRQEASDALQRLSRQ